MLNDRSGKLVGKYYGPPASWEAMDSSKVTATQVAVAPAGAGQRRQSCQQGRPGNREVPG
ncbi:hypothetical protein [Polaromonas sp. CG9_12]|nr:hypothetical protein [Polaromonas sp. CG9_12]